MSPALSGGEGAVAVQPRESLALLGAASPPGQGPAGTGCSVPGKARGPRPSPRGVLRKGVSFRELS